MAESIEPCTETCSSCSVPHLEEDGVTVECLRLEPGEARDNDEACPHYQRSPGANQSTDDLLNALIRRDGSAAQLGILQEECGECVTAVSHVNRGRDGAFEELCGEVADVIISARCAQLILGSRVDKKIAEKYDRIRALLGIDADEEFRAAGIGFDPWELLRELKRVVRRTVSDGCVDWNILAPCLDCVSDAINQHDNESRES